MAGTIIYNGQEYSRESQVGKEAAKFEQPHYRPEAHPYPRMLYRATKGEDGVVRADAGQTLPRHYFRDDQSYRAAIDKDEAFNQSCRMIVNSPAEHNSAKDHGWRDSAEEAIAYCKHFETVILGTAAAERAAAELKMSPAAQAEAKAIDASTPNILPEIPEAHKRVHWKTAQKLARDAERAQA